MKSTPAEEDDALRERILMRSQAINIDLINIVAKAEQYCTHEEQRIALDNHALIVQLRAELSLLAEEEGRVREQLRDAPAPTDLRHDLRRKIMAWIVAAILTVTGFFLAVLTFAPFRLGWQGYLFCAGIATVVPFLIHRLLDDERFELAIKALTGVAAVAGVASLMLLADVRGHLLEHEVQAPPAVVFDDAQPPEQAPPDDFYAKTLGSLRLATVLLALAMELGAGLALRDAMARAPHDPDEWERLREELALIRSRMVALVGEITRLEDGPASFHARFWRDFYRSMLTQIGRNAMTKLLIVAAAIALAPHARAASPQCVDLVIALDLTKSTNVKGPDGKTEFQRNVDGVTGVLAQVPAGGHVTVIGITDHSFAQPDILLSASVPDDPGHFGERLAAGRQMLMSVWRQRSANLTPQYPATDIVGVLELAGQIFERRRTSSRRVLVLFSDMRNETKELDLESRIGIIATDSRLSAAAALPKPDIKWVSIYALGVDGAGSTLSDWQQVEGFWQQYLRYCGANIVEYTVLRTTIMRH